MAHLRSAEWGRCGPGISIISRLDKKGRPFRDFLSHSLSTRLILQEMVGGAHPTGALSRGICRGNQCGQSRGKMPLLRCICLYPARRTAVQDAHLTTTKGRCGGTLGDFHRTGSTIALTGRSLSRSLFASLIVRLIVIHSFDRVERCHYRQQLDSRKRTFFVW